MKSIDERGREFSAKWLEQSLEQVSYDGYCSGAVEEHKLIVEKLTKWLKENNGKRFNGFDIAYTQGWIKELLSAIKLDCDEQTLKEWEENEKE